MKKIGFETIVANIFIFFLTFLLGVIIVGQFTTSQFLMGFAGSLCAFGMFYGGEHPKEFWIIKARQFIYIVGFVTLFSMCSYGIYVVGHIAGVDANEYIAAGMRTLPVIVVTCGTALVTLTLQVKQYLKLYKQN